MEKVCTKCNIVKSVDGFYKDRRGKHGCRSVCKECVKKSDKVYREENREKETERMREWRKNNPEKAKKSYLNHRVKNINRLRKEALEKQKKNRKDPIYKLKESIRNNIRKSMIRKGVNKTSKTTQILGCSFEEFRLHIESQWEKWMSWDNRGLYNGEFNYGWDLDHIIPISTAKSKEDIIRLNHFTNFQPLCSHTNRNIKKDII